MPARQPRQSASADAETIAIAALGWLAGEPQRLQRFTAVCGLGPDNLRQAAAASGFLPAVLDYLAANENLLIAFAAETGRAPADVARAAGALADPPGPDP
jgi:hypothetical protein